MRGIPGRLGRVSKRLVLSYVIDWIVILGAAAVGGGFDKISPNKRPIDLRDPDISFPYVEHEKVSTSTLILVCLVAPGVIIFLITMVFIPGPTADRTTPRALVWRRKLWEWFTGWSGLGLSLAVTFLITDGLKNLIGKPRPDLLNRCNPDLANAADYAVGGIDPAVSGTITLVTWEICQGKPNVDLSDGFRSFPSGHCSFAFAGLTYLTLFLCSKFSVAISFLAPKPYGPDSTTSAFHKQQAYSHPTQDSPSSGTAHTPHQLSANSDDTFTTVTAATAGGTTVPIRNQAAAPPNFLLILAFIPVAVAAYIATTRYSDFRHHGFDVIFGSLIGLIDAWFAFRWYHLPVRQGAGWSWGARSRDRAFGIGVGVGGYVGREGWASKSAPDAKFEMDTRRDVDLERGDNAAGRADVLGPGHQDVPEHGGMVETGTVGAHPTTGAP